MVASPAYNDVQGLRRMPGYSQNCASVRFSRNGDARKEVERKKLKIDKDYDKYLRVVPDSDHTKTVLYIDYIEILYDCVLATMNFFARAHSTRRYSAGKLRELAVRSAPCISCSVCYTRSGYRWTISMTSSRVTSEGANKSNTPLRVGMYAALAWLHAPKFLNDIREYAGCGAHRQQWRRRRNASLYIFQLRRLAKLAWCSYKF
ncbi:hypothetical protein DFH11DRAFT_122233 [Phellopilus nigrolimitatus]|nr:hypothetical protein DFH11DRAFT_122233 [Phellopilus nigrolimitatus]